MQTTISKFQGFTHHSTLCRNLRGTVDWDIWIDAASDICPFWDEFGMLGNLFDNNIL